jgi:hypothetical protein
MMGYWAAFARTGAPGDTAVPGRPRWDSFGADGAPPFMVFDTEAGGGLRLERGVLDFDLVFDSIDKDPRLRDQRERCAVFREVIRFTQMIPHDRYATIGKHGCKDFPFDVDPWAAD